MDIQEIIEESKILKSRTMQLMIISLVAGILLAYFRTGTLEIIFSCACGLIAIFFYRKHEYLCGFIEFLEKKDNNTN